MKNESHSAVSIQRQAVFWLGGFAVLIAVLWLLSGILLPFVAGFAVAYLLDPAGRQARARRPWADDRDDQSFS